jgi:hypothetical protein
VFFIVHHYTHQTHFVNACFLFFIWVGWGGLMAVAAVPTDGGNRFAKLCSPVTKFKQDA